VALSRLTTCSIRSSCIAFCGESRKRVRLAASLPVLEVASPRGHRLCQAGMATAVVAPRCFTRLRAGLVQVLIAFCAFVLWPFAVPGFRRVSSLLWPLLTSRRLAAAGSPWVSAAPVPSRRRALRAPFHDGWASLVLACSPTVARLPARSCSYGRRLASGPFARVPCGSRLAVRLRLSSSPRRGRFTPKGSAPARHTRPGALTRRVVTGHNEHCWRRGRGVLRRPACR
jgi:hypothetical protein